MGGPSKDPGGGLKDTRTISKSNLKISNHNKTPNKPCSNVCKKTTSDFSQEIEKIFQNFEEKIGKKIAPPKKTLFKETLENTPSVSYEEIQKRINYLSQDL